MTNWPTAPLIRIIRGTVDGDEITDEIAARWGNGRYTVLSPEYQYRTIAPGYHGDSIIEWEEVTAVPTAALKMLRDERGRETSLHNLRAAIDDVLESLPADKPAALDRAVTRVKDAGGPMVTEGDLKDNRLSLLLDALASVAIATNKTAPLVTVARICADWANMEEPYCDALREIAGRAQSDPTRIDFVGLTAFVGDVAASLDDGTNGGPRNDLLEMGHHALSWAAEIIEEEDR